MYHPTDNIAHTTGFVRPVVEHWVEREIRSVNVAELFFVSSFKYVSAIKVTTGKMVLSVLNGKTVEW